MKRNIALAVVLLVVGAIAFMGYHVWQDAATKRAAAERVQTLPAFEVQSLEGRRLSHSHLAGGEPLVLMYFSTTCRFCQNETESIKKHEALRHTAPVVMVSSEPRAVLEQFASEYGLAQAPGMRLARDPDGNVAETFGVGKVPSTFIYGTNGQLLEHFQGEASAEAIYQVLQGKAGTGLSASDSAAAAPEGCTETASLDDCFSDEQ